MWTPHSTDDATIKARFRLQLGFSLCALFLKFNSTMKLFVILACLLSLALGHQLLYSPGYSYYTANGLTYAHTGGSVVPLAYARLVAPATQVYHSVETPSSFQQQYRADYQPLTYEYLY